MLAFTTAPARVDVHQHVWTAPLLDALAARRLLPFVRRSGSLAVLHCAGEQSYVIDLEAETPARRARLVHADGLDLALVALSSPVGIEALPREQARELIEAHLGGVGALGEEFASWGPVALDQPDAADVDDLIDRGCVGVSIPAAALATGPDALNDVGPLLARAQDLGAPVFVHPGSAPGRGSREASLAEPLWWTALTDYVAQMQAAWLTFVTAGRRDFPHLTAVFAMLAGGAPLLSERLAIRGGPWINLTDPNVFYESSGYGPDAIEAMARRVGAGQLVYGSDRPVAEPDDTGWDSQLKANGGRFLASTTSTIVGATTTEAIVT